MTDYAEPSELLFKGPCSSPACGSSDAMATYSDGHTYCFSCGKHGNMEGVAEGRRPASSRQAASADLLIGEYAPLSKRRITLETCKHFGYTTGRNKYGETVQIANYYPPEGGPPVAQKVRTATKQFSVLGNLKEAGLFGQNLWRDGGKMVVVTEGEIDAMTVSQLQNNKWPVVSVQNGAQAAKKSLASQLPWLLKFDTIVLMFDDDEPGRAAAKDCAAIFPVGRCKIATIHGFKDANEALQAEAGGKVIDAIWSAKEYRPDGLLTLEDIADDLDRPVEEGLPWFDDRLTKLTHGRRAGDVIGLGAGTGVGKTDLLTQQVAFDLMTLKQRVALFFLEQPPRETGQRVAGKVAGKRFHVPGSGWNPSDLKLAVQELKASGRLFLYNSAGASFGATAWDTIKDHIRFLAHREGVRIVYLDHLTALAAAEEDERTALERITAEMAGLAQEVGVIFHFVSHLATPEGTPHEEGGRVMIRHFKGSRAIGFWSHFMLGMERNQQAEDPAIRQTTCLRILKDRLTGQATGECVYFGYNADTGRLIPADKPPEQSNAKRHGFRDESAGALGDTSGDF